MPPTCPRHFVTEADDLARALEATADRWPQLGRAQLLTALAQEGASATERSRERKLQRRLAALRRHSGVLTGVSGSDYEDRLREDWPQ